MYKLLGSDSFKLSKGQVGEWPNATTEVFLTFKDQSLSFNVSRWEEFYDLVQAANKMIFNKT